MEENFKKTRMALYDIIFHFLTNFITVKKRFHLDANRCHINSKDFQVNANRFHMKSKLFHMSAFHCYAKHFHLDKIRFHCYEFVFIS